MALEEVGRCTDMYGDPISVLTDKESVYVAFGTQVDDGRILMIFDAETRGQFIRLFAEAERLAGAYRQADADLGLQPAPRLHDVHVDWHMTRDEWEQLREVLLSRPGIPYIAALRNAGKLNREADQ